MEVPRSLLPVRFTNPRAIGDGAYGLVFVARDARRGLVAVKQLKRASGEDLRRFKTEFRALAALNHPNLVVHHELLADEDRWLLVMEHVDGDDFLTWTTGVDGGAGSSTIWSTTTTETAGVSTPRAALPERRCQSPAQLARLIAATVQLVDGLRALHAAGHLHCDVKPSNVLVERATGRVVVLDFGLVSARASSPGQRVLGTPAYLAPEQASNQPLDEMADWYAVGALLYEALAGTPPFVGDTDDVIGAKLRCSAPRLEHLGPDVPDELIALVATLLAPHPADRPRGLELAAKLAALAGRHPSIDEVPAHPNLIGRDAELAQLLAAIPAPEVPGAPALVLLHGPPGHGKSALLARFTAEARATDVLVLAGRTYQHAQIPFKALDEIIDEIARLVAREQLSVAATDTADLTPVFAALARNVSQVSTATPRDPAEQRRRAARALPRLLSQVARGRRLAIVLDDLHWADDDSAAFLVELLRSPLPALIVAAFRDEDPGAKLVRTLAHTSSTSLRLGPLDVAASASLIQAAAPELDPASVHRAAIESAGIPLFAIELARHVVANPAGPLATLDDALRARIARLPEDVRIVMELVAAAGAPIAELAVAKAAGRLEVAEGRRWSGIRALVADGLVQARNGRTGNELEAQHEPLRARVVAEMTDRLRVHGALADALLAMPVPDAERVAFHLRRAARDREAVPYLVDAAERAVRALALDRAAELLGDALAIGLAPAEAQRLRRRRADLLAAAGRPRSSADAYLEAASAATPIVRRELRRLAAEQLLRGGHVDDGMAMLGELARDAGIDVPTSALAGLPRFAVHRLLLARHLRRWQRGEPPQLAPGARVDEAYEVDLMWSLASGLTLVDPLRAAAFATRAALGSLATGDPARIARTVIGEVTFSGIGGTATATRSAALLAMARRTAAASGEPYMVALTAASAGCLAVQEGRMRAGEAMLRATFTDHHDALGGAWERATIAHFRAFALAYLGELDELRRFVTDSLADALARGDRHLATDQRVACANLVWLVDGGPAVARREIDLAMRTWPRTGFHAQHYYAIQARVHVALWEGDGAAALALIESVWPTLRRSLMLAVQGMRVDALWLRARARLAVADAARGIERRWRLAAASRDAARLEATHAPWARALASVVRARVAEISRVSSSEAWAIARRRCAEADLHGHPTLAPIWPVP